MPDTEPVHQHTSRGLDHGAWVPLKIMYPAGDIPVLQMSLPTHDPGRLMEIGRRLRPLRDEGVLVVGSGFLTHGLPYLKEFRIEAEAPGWSREFDAWAGEAMARGDVDALASYRHLAPGMPYAHPTVEHYTPLFVTLGAATDPETPGEQVIDVGQPRQRHVLAALLVLTDDLFCFDVYAAELATGSFSRVSSHFCIEEGVPSWSPDTAIIYDVGTPGVHQIFKQRATGTPIVMRFTTPAPGTVDFCPTRVPDVTLGPVSVNANDGVAYVCPAAVQLVAAATADDSLEIVYVTNFICPHSGGPISEAKIENGIKSTLLSQSNFFESLNLRYFGPVDGHDVNHLVTIFEDLRNIRRVALVAEFLSEIVAKNRAMFG